MGSLRGALFLAIMNIELHNRLGKPVIMDCTRVVIRDDLNNPVVVAFKTADRTMYVSKAGDKDFSDLVKQLGLETTIVTTIPNSKLIKPYQVEL